MVRLSMRIDLNIAAFLALKLQFLTQIPHNAETCSQQEIYLNTLKYYYYSLNSIQNGIMWAMDLGIKRFFYVQCLAFRSIGFDITSIENTFERPILTGYLLLCFTLLMSSWAHYSWLHKDDLDKITDGLINVSAGSICVCKIFTFMYRRKKLLALAVRIWLMTQKATAKERLIIAAENKIDRTVGSFYYISMMLLCVVISILPQFITLFVFLKTSEIKFFVPLKVSTPYDQTQPIYYTLTIIWIMGGTYFAAHCDVALDTLYSWFVHNIAAQFRVLQLQFTNAAILIGYTNDNAEIENAICRCIQQHQEVISLAEAFENEFHSIVFVEFFFNGFHICFLAFQLGRGVPMATIPFLLAFSGASLVQLMIYCYGGQRIKDESQLLGSHIYDVVPWHRISVRIKKLLLLPLLRAQKACSLTGIFFVADWFLFTWVIKTAFSYVTLLWSLVDEKK